MKYLIFLIALLAFSCGGCSEDSNNTTPTDAAGDSDATDTPQMICEPNALIRCNEENTPSIEVCSADGFSTQPSSCPNTTPSVCREGECVEVECIPGNRRCITDTTREECNALGTAWEPLPACEGVATCTAGECLDRCGIAELTSSYVGCEYWAVELDNVLLNEDGDLGPDEQPPYAIVLANTATNYDAIVTVYSDVGEVAMADASRLVGTDIQFPGEQLVTVRSELVDQNGVKLRDISGPIQNLPLPRQSIMTLIMPPRQIPFEQSSLTKVGYRVESTEPIVAYQFNPLCCNYNFTNDASLLLPTSALTENYMFMSYEVWSPPGGTNYSSTLTVIGTEADTQVTVALRNSRKGRQFNEILYPNSGNRIEGPNAQGIITATLGPHEVLNLAAMGVEEDITGARITASNPVAVFGGHTCAFVPDGNAACDHLESQLFPLETWGRRFIATPLVIRGDLEGGAQTLEGTYFKFLALEDDTVVKTGINIDYSENRDVLRQTSGAVRPCRDFSEDAALGEFTLDSGESCALGSKVMFVAESGKPLSVGAFLSGQGSVEDNPQFGDHNGDPAFFLLPPEEQFRSEYSFLTPATYFISYMTVIIRPGFDVILDGVPLDPTMFDYEVIEELGVARAHIPVEPGPHFVSSENQVPFGLIVYGLDDYVSYAFTGGLNLSKLNEL